MKLVQVYRATERYDSCANTSAIVNAKYQSVFHCDYFLTYLLTFFLKRRLITLNYCRNSEFSEFKILRRVVRKLHDKNKVYKSSKRPLSSPPRPESPPEGYQLPREAYCHQQRGGVVPSSLFVRFFVNLLFDRA